jgi:hypothetical protein
MVRERRGQPKEQQPDQKMEDAAKPKLETILVKKEVKEELPK